MGVFLLASSGIALCICKRRKARNLAEKIMKEDINDTYGDYSDPDPVVEMVDSNGYYTGVYEAGTTMTRDNNSQYGC